MNYLIFNGHDTRDMGAIIEKMPQGGKGKRRAATADPYGVNGKLYMDELAYDTYGDAFTLNCFGALSPREIFSAFDGEGYLISSDAPDKKRYVYLYDAQSVSRLRPSGGVYDSVTVKMDCDPFCYELTPEVVSVTNGQLIPGKGDKDARPLIRISGAGTVNLMVGGCTMIISGLKSGAPLYIDALTKYAYTIDGNGAKQSAYLSGIMINFQVSASDRWPSLKCEGSTAVSWTGAASVQITPQWRWF